MLAEVKEEKNKIPEVPNTVTVSESELEDLKKMYHDLQKENSELKERLNPKPIMDQSQAKAIDVKEATKKMNEAFDSIGEVDYDLFEDRSEQLRNFAECLIAARNTKNWDKIELDPAAKNAYAGLSVNNWDVDKFVDEYEPWLDKLRRANGEQMKTGEELDIQKIVANDQARVLSANMNRIKSSR